MLKIFENFKNRSIDYIPDILIEQTEKFNRSNLKYMNECTGLFTE